MLFVKKKSLYYEKDWLQLFYIKQDSNQVKLETSNKTFFFFYQAYYYAIKLTYFAWQA